MSGGRRRRGGTPVGRRLLAVLAGVAWLSGCGTNLAVLPGSNGTPDGGDVLDGNRDDSVTSTLGKTVGEPNGTFSDAVVAVLEPDGVFRLQGTVGVVGDLDVYRLGAMAPGDRLQVDTTTPGSPLDVSIALFDAEERLVAANDDRIPQNLDAYVELITRHAGEPYYLVVTHSAFAPSGAFQGSYAIDLTVTRGMEVPDPVGQVLLLEFDGGSINSPTLGSVTIRPFDAERISPVYAGQTDRLKTLIRREVEQNYQRFDVTIVTSDDPAPPAGVEFSTVFFGGFNPSAFGISESVDLYNADFCDDAIIYAETFAPSIFSGVPTTAELAVAIANVAAHEAGHLLGLNHVSDDRDLMDDRSPADAFIEDQEFMESPLSSDIMLIGTQDGVVLLNEIVGPVAPGTP